MSSVPFLQIGKQWPPEGESDRLLTYANYEAYYRRVAREVIASKRIDQTETILRYPNLISRAYAALMFGEPLRVRFDGEASEDATTTWQDLADKCEWDALNFEQGFIASAIGDAFYKASERDDVVRIDMVPGSIVFKYVNPDNVREVLAVVIAWLVKDPADSKKWLLRAEVHEVGKITHELFTMEGQTAIKAQTTFATVYGDAIPLGVVDGEVPTNVDDFLVHHAPNNRWGSQVFGEADISGSETILRGIEDRVFKIKNILDDHANPKMALPPGILNDKGQIERQSLDGMLFEIRPVQGTVNGLLVPQYITWDGELTSAQEDRDWLRDTFLMMTQIAPQLLNISRDGNAPSGSALRRMMLGTVAAVNYKRLLFNAPIRRTIRSAMALAGHNDLQIATEWQDGLPMDPVEQATIEQIRTGGKPTTSTRQAIMRLDEAGEQAADNTVAEIQAERSAEPAAPQDLTGTLRDNLNPGT